MSDGTSAGALVISLDFELRWGVRDVHPADGPYAANLLGARVAIPRILRLFAEYEVAATWATVGFLFASSRSELERFSPRLRPAYRNQVLDPYAEPLGENENDDPLHYAASLIEEIQRARQQEIGTHTFSHYYCGEAGQTRETFRADLEAACAIARARGVTMRSIVFPRNQHNPAYNDILLANGIVAFRGNPHAWMWRFRNAAEGDYRWRRAARLAESYLPIGEDGAAWNEVPQPNGLANVRASAFLRPYTPALRGLERLRAHRLRAGIRAAAQRGRVFHLWWHPHNFGRHQDENLGMLRNALDEFAHCRQQYGMRSLTMGEAADTARVIADPPPAKAAGVLPPFTPHP